MKQPRIAALGGCHIVGYPFTSDVAFPTLLSELLNGEVVVQVPNLQFIRLPEHLAAVMAARPSHVLMQMGNYEFSASLQQVRHQFKRAFSASPSKKRAVSASPSSQRAREEGAARSITPTPSREPFLTTCARLAGLAPPLVALWLCSPAYRRSFAALNTCMRQHPETAFVFLSPLPSMQPADNAMRRLGGWLLRRRLAALPNCHWTDSHQVLPIDNRLFADPWHLNPYAHRALAYALAGTCFGHVEFLPSDDLAPVNRLA